MSSAYEPVATTDMVKLSKFYFSAHIQLKILDRLKS